MAKEFREREAALPEIPLDVRNFINEYAPKDLDGDQWERISEPVRTAVKRAGFQTVASVRRHCTTVTLYLAWRDSQSLSLTANDPWKPGEIDQFYLRGMTQLGDRTKNDYRTRLRNLAARVAPTVATQVPSLGYNSVRPGYSAVEEAMIRRASLAQGRPETRREMCAIVGFGGGAGLDAHDLQHVLIDEVTVEDDGIHVRTTGAKARHIVVRREYEALVLVALEGLKPGRPVLKIDRNKPNPVARIIAAAQIYDDIPKIDLRRLRTTWITWLLTQRVPLDVIMTSSGLISARTLVDMIATLPVTDDVSSLRDGGAS